MNSVIKNAPKKKEVKVLWIELNITCMSTVMLRKAKVLPCGHSAGARGRV